MKLATIDNDTRDGRLVVVSQDGKRFIESAEAFSTLQLALDNWDVVEEDLNVLAENLESDSSSGESIKGTHFLSPLPRAYEWIDGSAYLNHVRLVRKARNAEPPATLETDPLVYQGGSGTFLAPTEDIPIADTKWGLDFEAEIAVILGDVPAGVSADDALSYVRLVVILNDVSLRGLIPVELKKSFGFFQSKPSTAFAPFAVTPDVLGDAWRAGRVHLPLTVHLNGERVGWCDSGEEMHFGFAELIAHIAKTRPFTAGTILGSGTISNEDQAHGISCLAERRMIEIIETGSPTTEFMKPGDHVRIEMLDAKGNSIFGAVDQKVISV